MQLKEFERQRVMNMMPLRDECRCPACKKNVVPRVRNHFGMGGSGMLWCPECLSGDAGIMWAEVGTNEPN